MSARLKVMHLLHFDGPGGGAVAVRNLAEHLREEYDNEYVTDGKGLLTEHAGKTGNPVHYVRMNRLWKTPVGFLQLVRLFRKRKPDILLLHGQWGGAIGALAGQLCGIKTIIYIPHFPAFYTDWDIRRVLRNRIAESIPCKRATKVVVTSQGNYYQYLIRRLVTEESAIVINNGVAPESRIDEDARSAFRKQLGWNPNDCHVVNVSRLAEQKQPDWLLKAWKIVCQQAPEAKLWIFGADDPERPMEGKLRKLAAQLNLTNVTFLAAQPSGARLGAHFIGAADIVAMTSLYEGHAIVPLEALLNGKPIVANKVDGVTDSFTDGVEGYLVPPGDIQHFADRLLELIRNPALRREMGDRGKKRAEHFHPDKVYSQYRAVLHALTKRAPSKEPAPRL